MKGNRLFIISIVALLIIFIVIQYRVPKKFNWTPSFNHINEQPFGCALFDSLLSHTLPQGYKVTNNTLYQMEQEDSVSLKGVLIFADNLILSQMEMNLILKMAERGDKMLISASSLPPLVEDTLKFNIDNSYFNYAMLRENVSKYLEKDTIYWEDESGKFPKRIYTFYSQFMRNRFTNYNREEFKTLALKDVDYKYGLYGVQNVDEDSLHTKNIYQDAVALVRPWGKGEIILISTPLLFTNYGVVDGDNATYILRILSQMSDRPIYRTQAYIPKSAIAEEREVSPLRFIYSQPPLRWAFKLTLIGIILFMIFTAKRRQRAIPVVTQPENKSLEFIELIGTLYYQKKDHANLVIKKYTYFSELLRREIQVDLEDMKDDEYSFRRMAQKTGMGIEEVSRFVYDIRPVLSCNEISAVEMERLIDQMNNIMNKIK